MIYTITLNPSLDKTLSVPTLRLGELNRAQIVRQDLSGKGLNVSRALRALGVDSVVIALIGGATGQLLRRGLDEAGFVAHLIEVDQETRQNITLLDESTGQYTKINEPGAAVTVTHLADLLSLTSRLARPGDLWALSGSLPPGAPPDLYAQLIRLLQTRGGRAILDTSGAALSAGLTAHPFAVKPNLDELIELQSLKATDELTLCAAVRQLEAQWVALTRGAHGLILKVDDQVVMAQPPAVPPGAPIRSPIGAGDATVAGLLWAAADGCDAVETARRAVACGTAAAMQEGTGMGDRQTVEWLRDRVIVSDKEVV